MFKLFNIIKNTVKSVCSKIATFFSDIFGTKITPVDIEPIIETVCNTSETKAAIAVVDYIDEIIAVEEVIPTPQIKLVVVNDDFIDPDADDRYIGCEVPITTFDYDTDYRRESYIHIESRGIITIPAVAANRPNLIKDGEVDPSGLVYPKYIGSNILVTITDENDTKAYVDGTLVTRSHTVNSITRKHVIQMSKQARDITFTPKYLGEYKDIALSLIIHDKFIYASAELRGMRITFYQPNSGLTTDNITCVRTAYTIERALIIGMYQAELVITKYDEDELAIVLAKMIFFEVDKKYKLVG